MKSAYIRSSRLHASSSPRSFIFFFFTTPSTTEIYTLSLHDALPISLSRGAGDGAGPRDVADLVRLPDGGDRKSTRLNSSHVSISYAVFCLKKKKLEFCSEILRHISALDYVFFFLYHSRKRIA